MGFLDSIFKKPLVGLDIGISGIKAVQLERNKKTVRLMAYNRVPLPWDAISAEGEIRDRGVVITALKRLFESRAFSSRSVALGTCGNSVITKKVAMPKMAPAELSNQLYWEAEQYLPFNPSEVNIDYVILGNSQSQGDMPMMDVLLVAAKKDYVKSVMGLVEEAGLRPEIVDSQSFALGNAFEFNYGFDPSTREGTTAIIDFGAGTTKISIVEGHLTTFTRELRQSGVVCTALIAERLGIPPDQAEKAKIFEPEHESVRPIVSEFVQGLVEEIARTLDFYSSQAADRTLDTIYVCGGASRTLNLVEALSSKISVQIDVLNPVQKIAGSGKGMKTQVLKELGCLGTVAIGLSLRAVGDRK
ncbi:MAG: type IV pilus assembly protein PilM [Deltaproteobacteria bacterium]|nr:type IV pilus assembly protein PilM [Deltaproteobacteria bacterium]MBI3293943.1 type IV pilus assembly protein PilM [Deltaproteobacteria bacterium]